MGKIEVICYGKNKCNYPVSLQIRKLNFNFLQLASQHLSSPRIETMEFFAALVTKEIKWAEARGSGTWFHQRPRLECLRVTETQSPGSFPCEVRLRGCNLDGLAWGHPFAKLSRAVR